ncbi:hypothetical protein [Cupriavidus basilensis]|nr:MAG TPA: AbiU2 [Inoviridae sp.]
MMAQPDSRFIRRILLLCCHCVRNIAYYRMGYADEQGTGELKQSTQFGATVNGNMIDIAVLEWCKLFADKKAHHHWKCFVRDDADQKRFLGALLGNVGLSKSNWMRYLDEMRVYRDKFVAHLDTKSVMNIPRMQVALESTLFLYQHVRSNVPQDFLDSPHCMHLPHDLNAYYSACCDEGREAFAAANKAAI